MKNHVRFGLKLSLGIKILLLKISTNPEIFTFIYFYLKFQDDQYKYKLETIYSKHFNNYYEFLRLEFN